MVQIVYKVSRFYLKSENLQLIQNKETRRNKYNLTWLLLKLNY